MNHQVFVALREDPAFASIPSFVTVVHLYDSDKGRSGCPGYVFTVLGPVPY